MGNERGMSLVELLAVMGLVALVTTATMVGSYVWIGQQASRSAVFHIQAFLQSTRAESVARHRPCRFQIEPQDRILRVIDLNDPGNTFDDREIARMRLAETARFERPDPGDAVSFPALGPGAQGATFQADGSVSSGAGSEVVLWGGATYHRLTLFGAGSVRVEHWNGAMWSAGI